MVDLGKGPGGRPPLLLDYADARRAEIFCKFSRPPPSPRPQLSLGLDPPAGRGKRYRAVHADEGCVICDRNAADFEDHSRYSKVIIN